MDKEDKHMIIINEIEHWRRNKLLPEHYCDFLLNLYLLDHSQRSALNGGSSTAVAAMKKWLLAAFGALLAAFIVLHFNSFHFLLQIGISVAFILLCYFMGFFYRSSAPVAAYSFMGIGSVFLMLIGIYFMNVHEIVDPAAVMGYIAICSLVYITVGLAGGLAIFHFCGWIGILLVYTVFVHPAAETGGLLVAQLLWVPFSALFGWIGWKALARYRQSGAVLLLLAVLLWFMPELYTMYVNGYEGGAQLYAVLGKLAAAAAAAVAFRKLWAERIQ